MASVSTQRRVHGLDAGRAEGDAVTEAEELLFSSDLVGLQWPDGKDAQEDIRRKAAGDYVLKIGIRLDGVR
jgi:hypothetical protein